MGSLHPFHTKTTKEKPSVQCPEFEMKGEPCQSCIKDPSGRCSSHKKAEPAQQSMQKETATRQHPLPQEAAEPEQPSRSTPMVQQKLRTETQPQENPVETWYSETVRACMDYRDHEPAREDGSGRLKLEVSEQEKMLRRALEELVRRHGDRAAGDPSSELPK